jgi:aspartyl-tRNA(Asn)/glutamyl-tRNA(Gln) amidotransferase subunit A
LPAPIRPYEQLIDELDVAGLRAVWSPDLGFAAVDPEVREIAGAAAEALVAAASLDAVEREVRFTDPIRVWMNAGALDLWMEIDRPRHWPARADDLTRYTRTSLEATADRPIPSLVSGKRRRQQLQDEMAALFDEVDVLITPTTAVPAFAAEGPPPAEIDGREVDGASSVPFTMLANLCWNPACSLPAGFTSAGLPVGLQVVARRHRDDVVLRLARVFEQARPWPRLAPG